MTLPPDLGNETSQVQQWHDSPQGGRMKQKWGLLLAQPHNQPRNQSREGYWAILD